MTTLDKLHQTSINEVAKLWHIQAQKFNLTVPKTKPTELDDIDHDQVRFWSELSRRGKYTLPDLVRILRGETKADPRPNKDLYEVKKQRDPDINTTIEQWNEIVRHGVVPSWLHSKPAQQRVRPSNHRPINGKASHIRRHLRKGQLEGRYLVVDASLLEQWPEVFISPLSVVDKPGQMAGDIRLINDYSFPIAASVNDYTDRSNHPSISYNPPRAIARRIHRLKHSNSAANVRMMLGDVAGAFRHIPIQADSVHMFGFLFENHLIIDLSCGFGWCGSPAYYAVAGKLINYLYEHAGHDLRQFSGSVWCDDHTCIEVDEASKCFDANLSLRRAMATVLGPTAINEQKFTPWSTNVKALGLLWDTERCCVSIPSDKIDKALDRATKLAQSRLVSKTALLKVLGSLRHVASCSRPARAFFQSLQSCANGIPRYGLHRLSNAARDDLHWFKAVLQSPDHFNSIPVDHFAELSTPNVHVFMDASGDGLCAIEPSLGRYIRQRFSVEESVTLSINIRELRSAVLAALHWGPIWKQPHKILTHVQFHIDNTTAVAWANQRSSRHPTAQLYNRLLSLAEFQYNLACTAAHIPGELNEIADAGSRAWDESHSLTKQWANYSSSWLQDTIDNPFDDLSAVWAQCCSNTPWHALPVPSIGNTGSSGVGSSSKWVGHDGSIAKMLPEG